MYRTPNQRETRGRKVIRERWGRGRSRMGWGELLQVYRGICEGNRLFENKHYVRGQYDNKKISFGKGL